MAKRATIELRDLVLPLELGTYGPEDLAPDAHVLDMTLTLSAEHVHIAADEMARVFDYDPLIAEISRLAEERHYETQEYLLSRIASACARDRVIETIELYLGKYPVSGGTGRLGVRLILDAEAVAELRAKEG